MKRGNHLMEKIADMDNLRQAYWQAAKGKRNSESVNRYQQQLELQLLRLRQQLLSGKVQVGNYRYFTIYEPKKRLICASPFAQQVLHHALMQVCHPYFERSQIYHSYASRKAKGTHAAVATAQANCSKFGWFLKLDVEQFFASIHHGVLKAQLRRLFKESGLLNIFHTIINSYEALPGRGLPIGNLTSQYFANHFLAGLDHFVLEQLRPGAYVRYMDDMVIWHHSKNALKQAAKQINHYIQQKCCATLKPLLLNLTAKGLPFLGYKVFGSQLLLTQRSKRRFIHKINKLQKAYDAGWLGETNCLRKALPLLAFIAPANTMALRKKVFSEMKRPNSKSP